MAKRITFLVNNNNNNNDDNNFELKMLKLLENHVKPNVQEWFSHFFIEAVLLKILTKKCPPKSDFLQKMKNMQKKSILAKKSLF